MADRAECEKRAKGVTESVLEIFEDTAHWTGVLDRDVVVRKMEKYLSEVIYDEQGEGEENMKAKVLEVLK